MSDKVKALAIISALVSSLAWAKACTVNVASENTAQVACLQGAAQWVTFNGVDYHCEAKEKKP